MTDEQQQEPEQQEPEAVNVLGNPEPSAEEIEAAHARNVKVGTEDPGYAVQGQGQDPAAMSEHERNLRQQEQYRGLL